VRRLRALILFVVLSLFWLAISARFDPFFLVSGALTAAAVTAASLRLLDATLGDLDDHPRARIVPFVTFIVWLVGRMVLSAVQIARIVLTPGRLPDPDFARFRTELSTPAARTILANSISLVPGTNTVDVIGDEFTIHAFTPGDADDLATAELQNRIARIFGDPEQRRPDIHWYHGRDGGTA
jgi:multicomponent Na+:H+ antiporter subunit E